MMRTLKYPLTICFVLAVSLCSLTFKSLKPGETVVHQMFNRWNGKWYPHFSFEQKAIFFQNKKVVKTEIWQEILSSPGNLHIRFDGFTSGNGAIYSNDSVYLYKSGVLQSKRAETNFLALLGFDIYFYQPAATVSKLTEMGFDLSKSYKTTFKNKPVVVVGTDDPADLSSSQFWVEPERQLVVRAIKNTAGTVRDVHFNNYQKIRKNWVATEMVFTNGADTVFVEEYFNIRFPKRVKPEIYQPKNFSGARW